jgi:hypothetical protein
METASLGDGPGGLTPTRVSSLRGLSISTARRLLRIVTRLPRTGGKEEAVCSE